MKNALPSLIVIFLCVPFYPKDQEFIDDWAQSPDTQQEDHLEQARLLLTKRAFLAIKPENENYLHAREALEKFIKQEPKNDILIALNILFQRDRSAYLKALAECAENEKYFAFAALLHNRLSEEERFQASLDASKHYSLM